MWVYQQTEPGLWTVGFFDPQGKWHSDSDGSKEECAKRVHFLNGGGNEVNKEMLAALKQIVNLTHDSTARSDHQVRYEVNAIAKQALPLE